GLHLNNHCNLSKVRGHLTSTPYTVYYLMGYRPVLFYFDRTAIPQITVDLVNFNPILIPPKDEADLIAEHIDHETTRIDKLITKTQESIALIKERKTALITAAVTGQIDVT
ncbi:MAG: restriction endonuclease subunit S, partial [Opitutales bacterium]